jgi:D-glycero-alpha-D-manno-heptose 1-phosphate guanylyltransferase
VEAIVLAGGLGTRLRAAVPDLPKPLAPIAGRPFLTILLDRLVQQGCTRIILSIGYLSEKIVDVIGSRHGGAGVDYVIENEPLGTGGALREALKSVRNKAALALNGDTFAEIDIAALMHLQQTSGKPFAMSLVSVPDTSRFGRVIVENGLVTGFREKGTGGYGNINAGVYVLDKNLLTDSHLPEKFSFETDFMVPRIGELLPPALVCHGQFIDIGVPEDFARAQTIFAQP